MLKRSRDAPRFNDAVAAAAAAAAAATQKALRRKLH